MARLNGIPYQQFPYDIDEYDFKGAIETALGCDELPNLHKFLGNVALLERKTDQSTVAHRNFYDRIASTPFFDIYRQFIHSFVEPLVGEPVIFQRIPTFRAHLPGNVAVGEWHRDSDYNHLREAITFWLPVTDSYDTNAVWIEHEGQRIPMEVPFGNVLVFDSMNIHHGNMINETEDTRVSVDFRVVPRSQFKPGEGTSVNTGVKMDVGGYYEG